MWELFNSCSKQSQTLVGETETENIMTVQRVLVELGIGHYESSEERIPSRDDTICLYSRGELYL